MSWCQWLFIICLLVFAAHRGSHAYLDYGVVYAKNGTFRFTGEPLDLHCNITNKDIRENSSMLHIERTTKKGRSVIPPEYIDILSTRAIQLTIWKVNLHDDGVYTCFQETFSGESRVLGSETIKVDYKPQKVREISCRVFNWERMRCTWELAEEEFQHPEFISVSLAWTIHGEQHDCPELTQTSCLWDSDSYIHGQQYWMVVEVRTVVDGKELYKERSPQFRIDTVLYVEPAPVSNLQTTVENSTCVLLTWQHNSVDQLKFFVAECRMKDEDKWSQVILNQDQEQEYQSLVCGLIPFTDYEFRMSVLPFPVETTEPVIQGYRSEWSTVSAKTLDDVPGTAPKICSGCFYDYKCSQGHSGRCVRIYWQSLKEKERHGILMSYNITYMNSDTRATETLILPVTQTELLYFVDLKLPSSRHNYKIFVKPGTRQGFSKISASIVVPAVQKKPNPPQSFLVETEEENDEDKSVKFYLSWAALNVNSRSGVKYKDVTVFWCCGQRHEAECQSDLHWAKLPPDQVTYELQPAVKDCHRNDILIGIAGEVFHDGSVISSGIHWSTCIYLRNQKPQSSPKNIRQSSSHPVNGLTVMWDIFECKEERSFITEYLVRYCPLYEDNMCMESEKSMNVSNTVSEVTLDHLKEDMRYKVVVIAVSSAGLGPSDPLITQAVKGSPLPESVVDRSVGISIGIFSFVIFLGLIIVLWRYCIYKKRKAHNTEDLIQPYAQSSESTPGSDKTKDKPHYSGSCSEESVESQTTLLLRPVSINQTPVTSKTDNKTRMKKFAAYKMSKDKNSSQREMKLLLNHHHQPSEKLNVAASALCQSSGSYPRSSLTVHCECPTLGHLNNQHSHAAEVTKPSHSSIPDTSWCTCKEPLLPASLHQQSGEFDDRFNFAEMAHSSKMNFNEASTLLLRKHSMDLPVCTASNCKLTAADPCLVCKHRNSGHVSSEGHRTKINNYTPKNPAYIRSYQPLPQQFHSVKTNNSALAMHTNPQNLKCQCECMTYHNLDDSYKQTNDSHKNNNSYSGTHDAPNNRRHSVPLHSVLHFPPPPTSPPASPCLENIHFTNCLSSSSSYPHTSHELSYHIQNPLVKGASFSESPAARTSFTVINNAPNEIFLKAIIDQSAFTGYSSTSPEKSKNSQSSLSLNISPGNNPAVYVEYMPQDDGLDSEGRSNRVQNVYYDSGVSANTFPRNSNKDTVTISLPSPLTRPLSGDLLELPPEYYEDPILEGSNPLLTEL